MPSAPPAPSAPAPAPPKAIVNPIAKAIAKDLGLPPAKVAAACALFDEGATLPFVARYRRERTGGLDEVALRAIVEQRHRRAELDKRRQAIRAALVEQGQLTAELGRRLDAADSRAALEDLYAPFKKRRKTRGDAARERGLGPLAAQLREQPRGPQAPRPRQAAQRFVSAERGVPDVDAALAGARDIVAEELAVHGGLRTFVRGLVERHAKVQVKATKQAQTDAATDPGLARRLRDLTDRAEPLGRVRSHRYLALCRAEDEGLVRVRVRPDVERTAREVLDGSGYDRRSPWAAELAAAVEDATKRLLLPTAERAVRGALKARADDQAIDVFEKNLEAVLMAAPLGAEPVLALDPGLRTGTKWAMLDATGTPIDHGVLYLVGRGEEKTAAEAERLAELIRRYGPRAVAVGNGTAGREALEVARRAVKEAGPAPGAPPAAPEPVAVSVNEAGASVYSASELAGDELPALDVTIRGAVSIGRRLQDPLAELVKIDPKSLGVGQYQHDVDQGKLGRRLRAVAEGAVNRVGVDVNTASPALLGYVAGVGPKLARAIVAFRATRGRLASRRELLDVPGLGPKTFEQCAGFLRVRGGANPLDASGVHPERYGLVQRMARELGVEGGDSRHVPLADLMGNAALVDRVELARYEDPAAGLGRATLQDIADELKRPGRDPRVAFEAPAFRDDVRELGDLEVGMVLHGVVTNVTDFGAFVDIGVHRDGLVHVSQLGRSPLSRGFVRSPHEVVSPGQPVRVQVTEVDLERGRISLTARVPPTD